MPDGILTVMYDFYSELYQAKITTELQEIKTFLHRLNLPKLQDSMDQESICEKEVLDAITKLNLGKSPGPDGFSAEFYKQYAYQILAL